MAQFNKWTYTPKQDAMRVLGGTPSNPKKMTGSRLGKVLGMNHWGSPFAAWCEIMRVAEPPFEENKYTIAGNVIEPKLLEFCKSEVSPHIITPEEHFGCLDAKKHTGYDFFKDDPIFGGMWDGLIGDGNGGILGVVEAKTSSRPQDWREGVPDSYAAQALLYAALLGVEHVYVPVAFLTDADYERPQDFVCTDQNTEVYDLSVKDFDITAQMKVARKWWKKHVEGNVSPAFDEGVDKKYLAIARKNVVESHDGIEGIAKEALVLEAKIETIREESGLDELEKRLKELKDKQLKPELVKLFGKTDDTVAAYGWQVKVTYPAYIDKEALEKDDLLEHYTKADKPKYTMTKSRGE